jgi:hypothetical protein
MYQTKFGLRLTSKGSEDTLKVSGGRSQTQATWLTLLAINSKVSPLPNVLLLNAQYSAEITNQCVMKLITELKLGKSARPDCIVEKTRVLSWNWYLTSCHLDPSSFYLSRLLPC